MSVSTSPRLVLRPALCRRGIPLGVGIPVLSSVMRRATGVATLLLSLLLSVSVSRSVFDMEAECECPNALDCPLIELRGRGSRPSAPLTEDFE
jgi:hypothetical protein